MNQHCPDRAQKARAGGFVGGVVGMVAGTLIGGPVVGVLYQVAGYVVGFASADVCRKPAPSQDKEALLVEGDRYPTTVITEEDL